MGGYSNEMGKSQPNASRQMDATFGAEDEFKHHGFAQSLFEQRARIDGV